ncbi:MAG TPA: glycoside hydrolase family 2 TIM barrel-domain containing protein [Tepidisphaeraceae bacterium]|jgi:beta-mannosidase
MHKQQLAENWTLRAVGDLAEVPSSVRGKSFAARVPGCAHTDLMRAGVIEDPYQSFNELACRWIGMTDWGYETTFTAEDALFAHERVDLVCDGLDTVARITLNGSEVARTQNMHRTYRFDIKPMLKRGQNTLTITFSSPVKYAEQMRAEQPRPYVNGAGGPFNSIRKMACNFGWDWGPALPTCGIWKAIQLEGWSGMRIACLGVQQTHLNDDLMRVDVCARVERATESAEIAHLAGELRLTDGRRFVNTQEALDEPNQFRIRFEFHKPHLWWPNGHGSQPLQELSIALHGYGHNLEERTMRIGLRDVELDTSPDPTGSRFALKVNGREVFCKGFNWIPDDCFLDRATDPQRVRERLQQAVDAGANMIRVWGGGIFETDEFYNLCDEMGILVWQDFLFACAMYAEEQFAEEVEAEVRDNVARLVHHPSLAIWNGCNENIWAYKDWGWKDHPDVVGKSWGKGYYLDLIPRVLKELDPARPYWAASPWSGDEDVDNGLAPNLSTHGNKHVWEAWFKDDYTAYRNFAPRFCSEFGFQGPATYASIAAMVPAEARDFGSPEMRHRQKSGNVAQDDGDRRNLRHLIKHFNLPGAQALLNALDPPDPNAKPPLCGAGPLHSAREKSTVNFDDLHYLLSVNQCRALTLGVEWFRSRQPICMGTLYWQLNDCWPGATTWSCIDGDGRKKPLWYATRRFFTPRLLTIQIEGDALVLYANNDCDELWQEEVRINRLDFTGTVKGVITRPIDVPPRTNVRVGVLPTAVAQPDDRAKEFIVADAGLEARATWFFAPDKEINYPQADFDAHLIRTGDEHCLTIRPKVLMRDCLLQVDRLDPHAEVEENLLTLIPGEERTFVIRSKRDLTQHELITPPVLMCVNRFGMHGREAHATQKS